MYRACNNLISYDIRSLTKEEITKVNLTYEQIKKTNRLDAGSIKVGKNMITNEVFLEDKEGNKVFVE